MKTTRVSLSEIQVNTLMKLSGDELVRQITHKAIDPLMAEVAMKMVKAKEKFMPERKEEK
jgi:hypothetical protein